MVWQYRTILFEFTKDGLLGDRYIDDEEMEKTLNTLGRDAWELVDVSLLQDGLLAIMKRPVEGGVKAAGPVMQDEIDRAAGVSPEPERDKVLPEEVREGPVERARPPIIRGQKRQTDEQGHRENPVYRQTTKRPARRQAEPDEDDFVGGIRIS